ncbi:MAG: TonB-dependent receptor [Candidatus Sulfotelmatobacter sp.]
MSTLCVALFSTAMFGQEFTGHVKDTSGAAVAGATITVHNQLTNVDISSKTTAAGDYAVPYLKPGLYSVSAEMQGFQKQVRTDITLEADSTVAVDFALKVGAVAETVTVKAEEALLDTDNASRNETFSSKTVTEVPNNGRDVNMTATLSTSVNFFDINDGSVTGTESGNAAFGGGWFTMSVNGGQYGGAIALMDGLPNDSVAGSGPQLAQTVTTASMESVEDFKVIANAYDAQYGNGSGGGFDTIIKSGTNTLHGSVYEFARRSWLNANPWVTDYYANTPDASANAAPQSSEDFYGFVLGGPVVIPHVYDGRNKLFFFIQYDDRNQKTPGTTTDSVPDCTSWNATGQPCDFTNPNTIGNFSQLYALGPSGGHVPVVLYDPLSGTPTNRNPFPNNTIPLARINPIAMKILSYFPAPNVVAPPGTNPYNDNYFAPWTSNVRVRNIMGKFDDNFTNADRFSFRGTLTLQRNGFANLFGGTFFPGPAGTGEGGNNRGWSIQPVWVHTFSPTLLLEVRASGGYAITEQHYTTGGFDPSIFGGGWTPSLVSGLGNFGTLFPNFNFTSDGFSSLGATLPPNWLSGTSFNLFPSVTWVKGKHTIHVGLDMRYRQQGFNGVPGGQGYQAPNFNVGNGWTQQDYQNSGLAFQGFDLASFLLGYQDNGNTNIVVNRTYSSYYYAPYVQDDWKVTPKLTLNLGLRYDLSPAATVRNNEMNYAFDTTSPNPVDAQVNHGLLPGGEPIVGGFTFAGVNGNPRSAIRLNKFGFQPRFGFAYALNPKTVVRGGFEEMLTGPLITYASLIQDGLTGFSAYTPYIASLNSGQTPNPNLNVGNPFPGGLTPITRSSLGLLTALGQGGSFYDPKFKEQNYWGYSLGVQRQLSSHDILEISYVGSRTYNLAQWNTNGTLGNDINQISPAWQKQCDQGFGGDPTICNNDLVPSPFYGISAFSGASAFSNTAETISGGQLTRPLPAFGDIYETVNDAKSWYNSLQTTVNHKWNNSLVLRAGWTWQKTMDSGAWADQRYDLRQKIVDALDMTHKISISGVYNLPVGRGRTFLGNANRFVDGALGGWELGSAYTFISGMPLGIGGVYMNGSAKAPLQNEDPLYTRAFAPCTNQWFQAANGSWSLQPVTGYVYSGSCNQFNFTLIPQYGLIPNIEYTGIRARPTDLFDVNLSKYFEIWENVKFQLRVNAFNVLNHPQFGTVPFEFDTGATDPNFGTYSKLSGSNIPRNLELALKVIW